MHLQISSASQCLHSTQATNKAMDDSSQDPVFSEEISGVDFERQCSVNSNFSVNDKIVRAKIPEVKSAPTVALETLSIEDVCFLLDHSQLSAIASTARENQFSGNILATGVESADDLKEFGIKSMFAQALFKHIIKWKANGVPADIFLQRDAAIAAKRVQSGSSGKGRMTTTTQSQSGDSGTASTSRASPASGRSYDSSAQYGNSRPNPAPTNAPTRLRPQAYHETQSNMFSQGLAPSPPSAPSAVGGSASELFMQQLHASSLAREKRENEKRELAAAVEALEKDMHHDSARMVLGLSGKYDVLRCCICKPDIARVKDPRPNSFFQLDCQHNYDLIHKVVTLSGMVTSNDYVPFGHRYDAALQHGRKRLQQLQG